MSKWDGRYETSRNGSQSLEKDILDAGRGRFTSETSKGGTLRESDSRIDLYGPSNSDKGHSHDWYNGRTGEHGHHD